VRKKHLEWATRLESGGAKPPKKAKRRKPAPPVKIVEPLPPGLYAQREADARRASRYLQTRIPGKRMTSETTATETIIKIGDREVRVHPAAGLFPMLAGDELRALGEDITKNGLQTPPVFLAGQAGELPQLLDGRNRLAAMQLVGLPVIDDSGRILQGEVIDIADPYASVASANLYRCHLTGGRAELHLPSLCGSCTDSSSASSGSRRRHRCNKLQHAD
jgi:hypothetical protein